MNPTSLRLANYRCFDDLELDLPTGCVAILGGNGAGKSSVVSAIELALFGPESRSLADYLSDIAGVDEDMLVELRFAHGDEVYRVRRTYSARGRGRPTLDFERLGGGAYAPPEADMWEPLTRESAKETQQLIEQTLGLSRETFRASAFLAQGDGAAFTEAQPRDRKRILAEVLGLDRYTVLLDKATRDRRTLDAELEQLAGRTQAARELADTRPDVELDHREAVAAECEAADAVADREREHAAAAERVSEARAMDARRRAALAELETAAARHRQIAAIAAAVTVATESAHVARDELASLPTGAQLDELEQRERDLADAIAAHADAVRAHEAATRERDLAEQTRAQTIARAEESEGKAAAVRARAAELEQAPDPTCQTCGQALPDDARARATASYLDEAVAHDEAARLARNAAAQITLPDLPAPTDPARLADLTTQRAIAATQLQHARADQEQRARLEERIRSADAIVVAAPADLEARAQAAQDAVQEKTLALASLPIVDLAAVEHPADLAASRVQEARRLLDTARAVRARLDERLAQIVAAEEQLAGLAGERTRLQGEAEVAVALERAFSANGIPMLIVENSAIPSLETDATRILADLGTSYRVELRTQAERKSGDGVRDTLDVVVIGDAGERPYETFSGGERARLNVALRIALARLLAHRRGAESKILILDEIEYLDEAGTSALVSVLRGLESEFDKLYLVSHVPGLRDAFDVTLNIEKDESGVSRVMEAQIFEEATA